MNESRAAGFTMLTGGALIVIGAFMPWITASAPFVGSVSRSLMDNSSDGWLLLIGGAGVLGLGFLTAVRGPRPWIGGVALIPLALAALVVVLDYGELSARVQNVTGGPNSTIIASVGPGPFASGFGILIALVACGMLVFGASRQIPAEEEGATSLPASQADLPQPPVLPGNKLGEISGDREFYWNGERWLPNS